MDNLEYYEGVRWTMAQAKYVLGQHESPDSGFDTMCADLCVKSLDGASVDATAVLLWLGY